MTDTLIIFVAEYLFVALPLIAGIWWIRLNPDVRKKVFILGVIAAPLSFIATRVASKLYFDPRPFVAEHTTPLISHSADNGFPSDHTALCALIAWIVFTQNRKLGLVLLALTIIVGAGRVAARVHSPTDILGSITITAVVVFAVNWLITFILHKRTVQGGKA
ncbi:MAG: YwoA [Candidatus Saccharibacteria bacterium]|nr:YwoA [Candidatus Saccharibacteria bacterium]